MGEGLRPARVERYIAIHRGLIAVPISRQCGAESNGLISAHFCLMLIMRRAAK